MVTVYRLQMQKDHNFIVHRLRLIYIRRICCSFLYPSSDAEPRWLHHSNSIELQISLNHGVNFSPGCSNICFSSSADTYRVSRTSLGFTFKSTSAWMNRM